MTTPDTIEALRQASLAEPGELEARREMRRLLGLSVFASDVATLAAFRQAQAERDAAVETLRLHTGDCCECGNGPMDGMSRASAEVCWDCGERVKADLAAAREREARLVAAARALADSVARVVYDREDDDPPSDLERAVAVTLDDMFALLARDHEAPTPTPTTREEA